MRIHMIALALAVSALAAGANAEGAAVAALQAPLAKPINVIAGDGYWACQDAICVSGSASGQSLTVEACRAIVKAAGPVSAYTVDGSSLRPPLLARCNAIAASR